MKTITRKFLRIAIDLNEAIPYSIFPLSSTQKLMEESGLKCLEKDENKIIEIYFEGIEKDTQLMPFPALLKNTTLYFYIKLEHGNLEIPPPIKPSSINFYGINSDNGKNLITGKINYNKPEKVTKITRLSHFKFKNENFGQFQYIEIQDINKISIADKIVPVQIKNAEKYVDFSMDFYNNKSGIYDLELSKSLNVKERFFLDRDNDLSNNDILIACQFDNDLLKYNSLANINKDFFLHYSINLDLTKLGYQLLNN